MAKLTSSKIALLAASTIVVFVLLLLTSEERALRLAVGWHSPQSALTMEYHEIKISHDDEYYDENVTIYFIDYNAPDSRDHVHQPLHTWAVRHIGPFNVAYYFGEG